MAEQATEGRVYHEAHGHVLKIVIDNVSKRNSFSPEMMEQLSDAFTLLENTSDYRVGVLCAAGYHFTAGLDMPKFFGPNAVPRQRKEGNVDPFGLSKRCSKPVVTAVQGVVFTIGIEMMLAGDIVIAADSSRFCQRELRQSGGSPTRGSTGDLFLFDCHALGGRYRTGPMVSPLGYLSGPWQAYPSTPDPAHTPGRRDEQEGQKGRHDTNCQS